MNEQSSPRRIFIAAAGTGGHLFPALHIAEALRRADPELEITFLVAGKPLEEKILGGRGFELQVVPATRIMQQGIAGLIKFFLGVPGALRALRRLYRDRSPSAVIGVGGYVTFWPIVVARLTGIPTWIHEAERKPGLANRVLSYVTKKISVAFEDATVPCRSKVIYTGHPVRRELAGIAEMPIPADAPKRVLVVGGSLGARALDEAMIALAPFFAERAVSLWHQTRPESAERVAARYRELSLDAQVVTFIDDIPAAFQWADLVICRAGAGTVMELGVVNRPALLVPYPFAQGNHQLGNAMTLVAAKKGIVVEEGDNFHHRLQDALTELLDPTRYREMRAGPTISRSLGAADAIARGVISLLPPH